MHIMYIDESGDTIPLSQGGKRFLVLVGCAIWERNKPLIEESFRNIKQKYYQDPDIEIKSNFLRYASPDLKEKSPIKLRDRGKYDDLEAEVASFLKNIPTTLFSAVIDKPEYWAQYPAQNPYETAYVLLLRRFQEYLEEKDSLGICIIDPREGQVEKSYIGKELDRVHDSLRWTEDEFRQKCSNIIEKILFAASDKTVGIQVADLYCYPVFNIFEYNKKGDEYWRFAEITLPKLHRKGTIVDDFGLKFFPEKTKRGLRYFA